MGAALPTHVQLLWRRCEAGRLLGFFYPRLENPSTPQAVPAVGRGRSLRGCWLRPFPTLGEQPANLGRCSVQEILKDLEILKDFLFESRPNQRVRSGASCWRLFAAAFPLQSSFGKVPMRGTRAVEPTTR